MATEYKAKRRDMLPLWTDAYLADTTHLDLEHHGAYFLLLMKAWRSSGDDVPSLPNDDMFLRNTVSVTQKKWQILKPYVMAFWTLEGDKWTQKKLTEAWVKDVEYRQSQSEAGKRSSQKAEDNRSQRADHSTEKRQQKQQNQGNPAEAEAVTTVKEKDKGKPLPKKPNRKTAWQDDWKPEPLSFLFAKKINLTKDELRNEYEKFKSNCEAHGRKYVNWQAAWRTWLTSDYGTYGKRQASGGNQSSSRSNASGNGQKTSTMRDALEAKYRDAPQSQDADIIDITPRGLQSSDSFSPRLDFDARDES